MTSPRRPNRLLQLVWVALLLLSQSAAPRQSSALQLSWNGGSTSLDFSANTRVVLRVQADSSEGVLPTWWRLVSVSDSS